MVGEPTPRISRWRSKAEDRLDGQPALGTALAGVTDHLRLCDVAVSLGDVFTLVYPQPKRDGLIRVSVGCEDVEDIVEDVALGLSFVE